MDMSSMSSSVASMASTMTTSMSSMSSMTSTSMPSASPTGGNYDMGMYMQYSVGGVVPFHLLPWLVAASFCASLVGTLTTVELLHRRISTSKRWLSLAQLFACAVSMGLVGIWCMHFIGNRAIILGQGEPYFQLIYSPGYTAISVFLPITFLFGGFVLADHESQKHRGKWKLYTQLVIVGISAGLSIVGMHYIGNFGILNYKLDYSLRYVAGAVIFATVDSIICLTFFFHMKELWINKWWLRFLTAVGLAIAVSGMHWVASVGVVYKLAQEPSMSYGDKENINLIVAVCLCAVASIFCICILTFAQRRKRHLADRAQQVVLASVVFDEEGRILLTNEGLLPSEKITRQFNHKSFDEEFTISHPVFQWIFRVTHNWNSVDGLIPAMRQHIRAMSGYKRSNPGSVTPSVFEYDSEVDYSTLFRESFCIAAADLASNLQFQLSELGVLYDGIVATGTSGIDNGQKGLFRRGSTTMDLEAAKRRRELSGKGQLMFIVKQAKHKDVDRLTSAGLRFANFDQVKDILARSMQIQLPELQDTMARLQQYCPATVPEYFSVNYIACFALRGKAFPRGFDILVPRDAPYQLPSVPLPWKTIEPWQQATLDRLDGLSVLGSLQWLNQRFETAQPDEQSFLHILLERITRLSDTVPAQWFQNATFCSKPQEVKYTSPGSGKVRTSRVYAFCIIPDVHTSSVKPSANLTYTPLSFFKTRQRVFEGSPDHRTLAIRTHNEFTPIFHKSARSDSSPPPPLPVSPRAPNKSFYRTSLWSRRHMTDNKSITALTDRESSSIEELVDYPKELSPGVVETTSPNGFPFGGILVSSETAVVEGETKQDAHIETHRMGTIAQVSVDSPERERVTYVDNLYSFASSKWGQKSSNRES